MNKFLIPNFPGEHFELPLTLQNNRTHLLAKIESHQSILDRYKLEYEKNEAKIREYMASFQTLERAATTTDTLPTLSSLTL